MRPLHYAAPIRLLDLAQLASALTALEAAGCAEIHLDTTDGAFAQGFGFGPDMVAAVKRSCGLPCHVHLQAYKPAGHLRAFAEAKCDALTIHAEAEHHLHRTLALIRELEMDAGIALNPSTPLTVLDYLLDSTDRILLLAEEPGTASRKPGRALLERVQLLREYLDYRNAKARIEVEADADAYQAARIAQAGADALVLGASALNHRTGPHESFTQFRDEVATRRKVV